MALSQHINNAATKMKETDTPIRSGREARLQKRVEFWSNVKGIGKGFSEFDENTQMNLAAELDNQAGHMAHLTETQLASAFNNFTPENMLRLVRLAMPNVIRSKIFTEFAMETARDSIKYVRPVYSKTQNGKELIDKTDDFSRIYEDVDDYNDINDEKARRAIYESTDDRINQALANVNSLDILDEDSETAEYKTWKEGAIVAYNTFKENIKSSDANYDEEVTAAASFEAFIASDFYSGKNTIPEQQYTTPTTVKRIFRFIAMPPAQVEADHKAYIDSLTDPSKTPEERAALKKKYDFAAASKKWGLNGENYVDGYGVVYYESELYPIAQQDKRTKKWLIAQEWAGVEIVQSEGTLGEATVTISGSPTKTIKDFLGNEIPFDIMKVKCFARYDDEQDFNGDFLGEIEIKMSDYEFRPKATTIGVTWSQMSEIQLDTSFSLSAEEYLITYAASTIKMELDYRAIKIGYMAAKTNPAGYLVEFDAQYASAIDKPGAKDSYKDNAQTFISAISTVGDNMFNDIKRGGVSRLVAGPSAGTYCQLMMQYTNKGAMVAEGAHQIGELDGKPLFKVPASVIPTNEILTVWKNPSNDADIAIAFGTLVPFFSTGVIQRKNFYKEAGLATYGDWAIINRRYLAIIRINNLKDMTTVVY